MSPKTKKLSSKKAFSKSFLSEMKETLEAEKEKLERELSKFAKKNPNVKGDYEARFPDYGTEVDDDVHEVEQYTVNKTLEITLEKKLRDVNAALKRFDDDSYGICKYTGEKISEDRLRARPTSSSSVNAKKVLTQEA